MSRVIVRICKQQGEAHREFFRLEGHKILCNIQTVMAIDNTA